MFQLYRNHFLNYIIKIKNAMLELHKYLLLHQSNNERNILDIHLYFDG
jgi:hypothetical protein